MFPLRLRLEWPGLRLWTLLLISFSAGLCLQADDLNDARALFTDSLEKLTAAEDQSVSGLKQQYLAALERLRETAGQQGDLEQVLQIDDEKKWITDGSEPPELPADAAKGLADMRTAFGQARYRMQMDTKEKKVRLASAYLSHLEKLQKKRVQSNDIAGAMKCREEIVSVESLKAGWSPEPPPAPRPATPEEGPAPIPVGDMVSLRWHPRTEVMNATLTTGAAPKKVKLEPVGRHQLSLKGLDTREGGMTRVPKIGEAVSEACKKTNAVTIVVGFETDDLKQSGPARIIGISEGAGLRNFTIGQDRNQLILRFRTTETDLNGTNPQISLGDLVRGRHTQVAISYSEEKGLSCYRDGREVKTHAIGGSLENWEPMGLYLGNESTQDRQWIGEIRLFELRSEAVSDADAARLSRER